MDSLAPEAIQKRLHVVGTVEGISFLILLLIAMPLKYLADLPQAVSVVGMAHGVLFVLYVGVLLQAWNELKWRLGTGILGLASAVVPFGPWLFEARILNQRNSN